MDCDRPRERLDAIALKAGEVRPGPVAAAGISPFGGGRSLGFRAVAGGGLALGQPGLGGGAAAGGGDAAGFAAAAFGGIGPLPRAGERSVSAGTAHLARALWEYKTGSGVGFPTFEELERTKGAVMTTVVEAAWNRREAKVQAEGIEQGVEHGVRLERMNEAAQRCAEIIGPGLSSLDHGDILHDERGLPKSSSHS